MGAAGGLENPDAWIDLAFQFGLLRGIQQAEAKTTKDQTIRKRMEAAFIEPMQCKPVSALPAGGKWTFEIKFDGYRCIAVKHGREITLFSGNKKVLNRRFPKVVEALVSLEGDFVLDGELVALDSQGRPSFQIVQNNLSRDLPVYFYAFDLLNRNGELLLNFPIEGRSSPRDRTTDRRLSAFGQYGLGAHGLLSSVPAFGVFLRTISSAHLWSVLLATVIWSLSLGSLTTAQPIT